MIEFKGKERLTIPDSDMVYKPMLDIRYPVDYQCASQSLLSHVLQGPQIIHVD